MQDLKVILVEIDQVRENKNINFDNYNRNLQDIDADLILLPEMFNTGFTMNAKNMAEDWEDSFSIRWLQDLAKKKNAAIYTSLIIREKENYYNRGVFIYPNGTVKHYDKRKSFGLAGEDKVFSSGSNEVIVNYNGWNIQLQICYDLRFPEIVRNRLVQKKPAYDIILYVANWPEKRITHWDALLKARAIENQCYVIAVNRIGVDPNNLVYNGHSTIINALGEKMNDGNLNYELLQKTREKLPFLA